MTVSKLMDFSRWLESVHAEGIFIAGLFAITAVGIIYCLKKGYKFF